MHCKIGQIENKKLQNQECESSGLKFHTIRILGHTNEISTYSFRIYLYHPNSQIILDMYTTHSPLRRIMISDFSMEQGQIMYIIITTKLELSHIHLEKVLCHYISVGNSWNAANFNSIYSIIYTCWEIFFVLFEKTSQWKLRFTGILNFHLRLWCMNTNENIELIKNFVFSQRLSGIHLL